ncbi:glycosyl hydrolase 53 [Mytilinidion resinicola]|uniref:Arabinogalactan endo-beta-1,4-galactanase n=1 Tax=Mytilinidion resinicola TaxID=574789 RepID=A0A6A6Y7T1_9PEZI|nr:glycosyl hydrolase 53 [Mytilinidion resinicola]KAF2803867.1 glycosyl hydrolase 53 [Mytilinidion resinicola]
MLLVETLIALLLLGSAFAFAFPASEANGGGHGGQNAQSVFYQGHDLSSLGIMEQGGAVYHDTARHNQTRAAEDILGDGGMNTVRLRLWVNPIPGQYDLSYVLALAERFAKKKYHIYLDFHFSDNWADPHHNIAPAAWPTTLPALSSTLRTYVRETIMTFKHAGVDLSLVSLGNEIRNGMLWPLGQVDVDITPHAALVSNFTNLATLYAAARSGVTDAVNAGAAKPQVLIHIDNGWNVTLQTTWFNALTATGKVKVADWDVFAFSFYPFYGTDATLANLQNSLHTLARHYGKPLHVVETDWPAICSGSDAPELSEPSVPISAKGQTEWVHDVIKVVKGVPGGLGQGFNYWEPAWLNSTSLGSACQDAILFDTDWSRYPQMEAYSRESVDMLKGV